MDRGWGMHRSEFNPRDKYIICPEKGQPRKHVAVCLQCRRKTRCRPFRRYVQPELPFGSDRIAIGYP